MLGYISYHKATLQSEGKHSFIHSHLVKEADNGSAASFIKLFGISIDDLLLSNDMNKFRTWVSVTVDITKLLAGDDKMYCVGFSKQPSILLAKLGPTLTKCLLN